MDVFQVSDLRTGWIAVSLDEIKETGRGDLAKEDFCVQVWI